MYSPSIPWLSLSLLWSLLTIPSPTLAQGGTNIGIPSLNSFTIQSASSSSMFFSTPPSGPEVTISVALCSNSQPLPRFFVSTISGPDRIGPNDPNSQEITLQDGVGWWTGEVQSGASIAAFVGDGAAKNLTWTFEIGVQEGESPAHGPAYSPPTLGDTTATQAIVFSPSFENITNLLALAPKWPNYTLPALQPTFQPPALVPPHSILVLPTPATLNMFPFYKSACALRQLPEVTQAQEKFNASMVTIVRDPSFGWQTQFLIPSGLNPSTNYTVWVTQGPKVSGPIYMYTKSASFSESCVLVHSLSYCPMVSYPIPLPASSFSSTSSNSTPIVDESTLPAEITRSITESLTNFSMLLSTFACGRDVYSPLHDCADCFDAYRVWACFVSLPRCTEPLPGSRSFWNGTSPTADPQLPFAFKNRSAQSAPRAAGFPVATTGYTELLPCLETCQAVRRTCPPFLQWACPVPDVNAAESYALGVWDSWNGLIPGDGFLGESNMGNGTVPVTDQFGRIWCNGV